MKNQRVAITGIGIVSPLGHDAPSTWQNLLAGMSGVATIAQFDASGFPSRIAAEVKGYIPRVVRSGKHMRYVSPFTQYAVDAAAEAFADAGILPNQQSSDRWGVVVGSGMMTAEYELLLRFQETCALMGDVDWTQLQQKATEFYQ